MNHYMIERTEEGLYNLYSPRIGMNVLEDASLLEVKVALATEKEYATKLEIIKLFMTFPHGYTSTDGKLLENNEGLEKFNEWYNEVHKKIPFPEQYYQLIDLKLQNIDS